MWYKLLRPFLFSLDAEFSHDFCLKSLNTLSKFKILQPKPSSIKSIILNKPVHCFGLIFPNPLGLAAGLDKNADCLGAWNAFGFGFIEVGTVTPKPQPGNPKPRLFRLTPHKAIINRMGFNNKGVEYVVERLKALSARGCPIGVNIGKNKDTPLNKAAEDYLYCFQKVYEYADYVTVNLSSPNTPGLKSLQHGEALQAILKPLVEERKILLDKTQKQLPILVKISPDLTEDELKTICDHLVALKIDGIIATNTTIQRDAVLLHSPTGKSPDSHVKEEGGLSGEPLFEISTHVVRQIYQHVGDVLPIIAVGGIMTAEHANAKLAAGAKLLQIYSGLIYEGPDLITKILSKLRD